MGYAENMGLAGAFAGLKDVGNVFLQKSIKEDEDKRSFVAKAMERDLKRATVTDPATGTERKLNPDEQYSIINAAYAGKKSPVNYTVKPMQIPDGMKPNSMDEDGNITYKRDDDNMSDYRRQTLIEYDANPAAFMTKYGDNAAAKLAQAGYKVPIKRDVMKIVNGELVKMGQVDGVYGDRAVVLDEKGQPVDTSFLQQLIGDTPQQESSPELKQKAEQYLKDNGALVTPANVDAVIKAGKVK